MLEEAEGEGDGDRVDAKFIVSFQEQESYQLDDDEFDSYYLQ